AKQTKLNRESLYSSLSVNGNPKLASLTSVLHSIGLKLAVEIESATKKQPAKTLQRTA
ncbi:MAG: hypothetical protein V3V84_01330, partial [Candidatus Bathyarchaeia archaeon]